jgi:hypothetical protein
MEEKPVVSLVPLAEALKVRTISKGPPLTYFVLKPVQKFLHKILRKKRVFDLLGRPHVQPQYLKQVLAPAPMVESESDLLFHSLDYESATDLLDPEVSGCIVDEICASVGMPEDLTTLFHRSLTGHRLSIREGRDKLEKDQEWGQLMGSITSFIVLCLANAAVVRKSYEISVGHRVRLDSCPMMINGDDGLVRAPPNFSTIWKDIAASAGLKPSIGKVYSHPIYMNINSTSFEYDEGEIRHIPYVNMGLVAGLQRSGGKVAAVLEETENDGFSMSLGARHHSLLRSCPYELRERVHQLFLSENRKALEAALVPWYVSESWGGVGLMSFSVYETHGDDVDDVKVIRRYGPTALDSACVSFFESSKRSSRLPVRISTLQPILCRSIWSSRLDIPGSSKMLGSADEGFLDVATFYLLPHQVMTQKPLDKERLRANRRAWAFALQQVGRIYPSNNGHTSETPQAGTKDPHSTPKLDSLD